MRKIEEARVGRAGREVRERSLQRRQKCVVIVDSNGRGPRRMPSKFTVQRRNETVTTSMSK